ncbi:hypothetical protein K2173_007066 [Erythroxylum novogranatense]|uniref:Uncharacterized protein n=1 Tax=Erythroxylum novogranatense TaxID=1862640 RepID=A0AAV8SKF4_9ROSI|nr:hypothetical protein K2173_007066 [Erythroxylum novogranatense]
MDLWIVGYVAKCCHNISRGKVGLSWLSPGASKCENLEAPSYKPQRLEREKKGTSKNGGKISEEIFLDFNEIDSVSERVVSTSGYDENLEKLETNDDYHILSCMSLELGITTHANLKGNNSRNGLTGDILEKPGSSFKDEVADRTKIDSFHAQTRTGGTQSVEAENVRWVSPLTRLNTGEICKEELNNSQKFGRESDTNLQTGSLDGTILLCLGVSIGLIASFVVNRREVGKVKELLKQTENLVQDVQEEIEMRDALTLDQDFEADIARGELGAIMTKKKKKKFSPRELCLRLHEVIQAGLEEHVKELESALESSQRKVQIEESDHRKTWRKLSSSKMGFSSVDESWAAKVDGKFMRNSLVKNLPDEALDAHIEACEELRKTNESDEEESISVDYGNNHQIHGENDSLQP